MVVLFVFISISHQNQIHIFFLLPVVLFINQHCFDVSWNYFLTDRNYFLTYMKLLTTRSVDYHVYQGHDIRKRTMLLSFSNVLRGHVAFSPNGNLRV